MIFILACETGKVIGSNCVIAVPSLVKDQNAYSEKEVFEDTVNNLKKLLDIAGITICT